MDDSMKRVMIGLFAEVLSRLDTEEERMNKLEEFDTICGAECSDWEEQMKIKIAASDGPKIQEAIQSVDNFHAKYHVYDENGHLVYQRTRVGNSYHQLVITFDAKAPKGMEITVEEVPDIEAMSLDELQNYYEELHSALDELSDEEPEDEDSEEYDKWENQYSDLEDLLEEISERLEELGGDV